MQAAHRTFAVVAAASLVALATTFAAQAAPGGGAGGANGSRICSQLQAKLGDRFSAKFASLADCQAQLAPVGQAAVAACSAQVRPSPAFRRCVQSNVRASLKAILGGGPGPNAKRAARPLGKAVCARLAAKNPTAFAARFGDAAGCQAALAARAKAAIAGCAGAAQPRTAEFRACVKAALQAAHQRPAAA